ncbi:hypothetical protein SteCoe_15662 [Stentor coeruleus]|uniref:Protein kinase domain-containing protein n=1 Tax=Stentor coeruleus TaxID=5963 RepID=A0A1R2C304_9CILI|nr:hypothetical protein SteCoe_15662 [Stentor coeruleus]
MHSSINHKVSYNLEDFKLMRVIYNGSLGVIKIALHEPSETPVVLKIISKYTVVSRSKTEFVMRERNILKQIKSPFIVRLLGTFQDIEHLYMVEEFLQGGDLFRLLKNMRTFPLDLARFYTAEIVCAINHLHCRGVIYRGLKPENLALDQEGHIRLVDFGMSKRLKDEEKTYTLCGTPDYLPPEIILATGHNESADWWTVGIFLFEIITGKPPFIDKTPVGLYEKILNSSINFTKITDPVAENLLTKLLVKNPIERINAFDLKKHEFFSQYEWRFVEKKKITPPYVPEITSSLDSSNFPFVECTQATQPFVENVDLFPGF